MKTEIIKLPNTIDSIWKCKQGFVITTHDRKLWFYTDDCLFDLQVKHLGNFFLSNVHSTWIITDIVRFNGKTFKRVGISLDGGGSIYIQDLSHVDEAIGIDNLLIVKMNSELEVFTSKYPLWKIECDEFSIIDNVIACLHNNDATLLTLDGKVIDTVNVGDNAKFSWYTVGKYLITKSGFIKVDDKTPTSVADNYVTFNDGLYEIVNGEFHKITSINSPYIADYNDKFIVMTSNQRYFIYNKDTNEVSIFPTHSLTVFHDTVLIGNTLLFSDGDVQWLGNYTRAAFMHSSKQIRAV